MAGASAAQGAVEYGIDKGRQMVEEGQISYDDSPANEARKAISYVPGVNLAFDALSLAADDSVTMEESQQDILESTLNTLGWVA
jgi:hypothetical protein